MSDKRVRRKNKGEWVERCAPRRCRAAVSTTANTAAEAAAADAAVKKYKAKGCLVTGAILGMVTMNTNMNPILVIIALQLQHFTLTLGVGVLEVFPDTR